MQILPYLNSPRRRQIQHAAVAEIAAAKLANPHGAWHPDGIIKEGQSTIVPLMVVKKEELGGGRLPCDATAYVGPGEAAAELCRPTCLLQHRGGSDYSLTASATDPHGLAVPAGCIALDLFQRMNFHITHNTVYDFEVRLLPAAPCTHSHTCPRQFSDPPSAVAICLRPLNPWVENGRRREGSGAVVCGRSCHSRTSWLPSRSVWRSCRRG
jgi:hypothetical protein